MKCWHPDCTGVHDNNRYGQLCPRSLDGKRDRDSIYYGSMRGVMNRLRKRTAAHAAQLGETVEEYTRHWGETPVSFIVTRKN